MRVRGNNLCCSAGLVVLMVASLCSGAQAQTWQSAIVYFGTNGKLVYVSDSLGNRIPDFSHAGYRGGGVAIPPVAEVKRVYPVAGDNTARIQGALDSVGALPLNGDGIRGALVLAPGVYPVYGTLRMRYSGVVLRGSGDGSDSLTSSIIKGMGNTPHQRTILVAGGGSQTTWRDSVTGTKTNILTDTILVGSRTFRVENASPYAVGDNIVIYHPCTEAWLGAINYGGTHSGEPGSDSTDIPWTVGSQPIVYNRYITRISGDTITIDAPVFNTLVRSLSQSYIYKYARQGLRTNIGIENLRIDIETAGGTDENHAWHAVELWQIEDAWMKNCTMLHFGQSGVMTHTASRITIDSCNALDPVSLITGERRYNFNMYTASQQILVSNCTTSHGRHDYVSNGMSWTSGCVFLDCTSLDTYASSEGHRRWTTGFLFDNITFSSPNDDIVLGLYNRGHYGTSHGWAVAHSVAWNCNATGSIVLLQQPPTAQNYAVGVRGTVTGLKPPAGFDEPEGYIEGTNQTGLNPRSLYLAQLAERLAPPQYTITASAGSHGTILPEGVVSVEEGADQAFVITPAPLYEVDSLLVDGVRVDSSLSYTFVNVTADHTIRVVFDLPSMVTLDVPLATGWNLIANPVTNPEPGDSVRQIYPTSELPYVFAFGAAGYAESAILEHGTGYWGKFPGPAVQQVSGSPLLSESVAVTPGWNLVGTISCTVDTGMIVSTPPGLRASSWYGYSLGYAPATQLAPGKAYWIRASAAGVFTFVCPPAGSAPAEETTHAWSSLKITDSGGGAQTLLFGPEAGGVGVESLYLLPPPPPEGGFDARFQTVEGGSMLRTHPPMPLEAVEFPLTIRSDAYPVALSWRVADDAGAYTLTDGVDGGVFPAVNLMGEGSLVVTGPGQPSMTVVLRVNAEIPAECELLQNYPNPFNPGTTIRYALPQDSRVRLRVFNVLGQEVATLLDEDVPAGYHTVKWNGTGSAGLLGSGVYFLRISATGTSGAEYSAVRKLMMVK